MCICIFWGNNQISFFSQHHSLKRLIFLHCRYSRVFCWKLIDHICLGLFPSKPVWVGNPKARKYIFFLVFVIIRNSIKLMLPFFSSLSPFDVYPLSFSPAFTLFLLSHHNPAHHYVRIYSLTQVAEETPRSRGQDTKLGSNIVSQGKGRGHPIPPTPAPSPKCVISTTSLHTFLAWSAAAAAAK